MPTETAPGPASGGRTRPRVTAAVLAGGTGTRMGGELPKQLLPLAGRPIIEHAIAAFCAAPDVDDVIVVMVEEQVPEVEKIVADAGLGSGTGGKVTAILPGGATRTASSHTALRALDARPGTDLVLLHDAARPLVSAGTIRRCVGALAEVGAAGVAVPSSDTVVAVEPGASGGEAIRDVPPRTSLRRMQTPQGFRLDVLRRAYELALADPGLVATDDCGVVLRYLPDEEVRVIEGEESNIKVTNPGDVEIAEVLLRLRDAGGAS
ncbi:2-C-methyl-D-erythritol 4-phosphate cytidylyltransferase [Nocardiopsis gilva YIM 90087]|uniref:2-C-methyl-D-erythritol 4-phosphate cytidylyltransferase n=1 Tax=Nocardiopsis gilva YIM 90087 TaxID=1235441 RepID=A0A223SBG9_9ACTN|nr:IspD/TarI family cytidylyltransferase [Nocardiopsis gilva]ASU85521.1 2-C-methyl-D-erythritol 4-phosphate cytidylyltransferase [Nocardiopsis gilva YIM 90087]